MAKELPYFRFTVSEWMNGDINMESYEIKGVFIDVCSWYWFKDCDVTRDMLDKKFENNQIIQTLFDSGFIKKYRGKAHIGFLDVQWEVLMSKHVKLSKAGYKGGKSKGKAPVKPGLSYKDKDNYKDKDKDKIPPLKEFIDYAKEKKADVNTELLGLKYEAWKVAGWKDGNGKTIVNWKSKLLNTLPYLKENKKEEKNLYPGYVDSSFD